LTYTEFELLRYLAVHPGQVFTRTQLLTQLLTQLWDEDFFGGIRTVDVHVRRLRAKLGDHEHLISTVRNVGYKLIRPPAPGHAREIPTPLPGADHEDRNPGLVGGDPHASLRRGAARYSG
jgi:DNA-binding winged helix-turn-helix (wHTH) protein